MSTHKEEWINRAFSILSSKGLSYTKSLVHTEERTLCMHKKVKSSAHAGEDPSKDLTPLKGVRVTCEMFEVLITNAS